MVGVFCERVDALLGRRFPHLDRVVRGAGHEVFVVRRESHAKDPAGVTGKGGNQLSVGAKEKSFKKPLERFYLERYLHVINFHVAVV